ncbi:MAG: aspartate aminotransferase family protein [Bryobacterales bacterium]|nr:aspartate aminotransferase family protein [Bryobacterales bacterium]
MTDTKLLEEAARRASAYLAGVGERRVWPAAEAVAALAALDEPLPEEPAEAAAVLELLDRVGTPATVTTQGGRFFGFVTGSAQPAALAASWLVSAWDQNAAMRVMSPTAAAFEDVALRWLRDLLGLPMESAGAVVTGATMANFTGLAAARHALLERAGWDVENDGLFGAPELTVVVGEEVHVSLLKALGMLGLGRRRVVRVPVDGQGRMRADTLPALNARTIVCVQAGNVNTGAFDPAREICAAAKAAGAWVHVDGAFGLFAAASPKYKHLTDGFADADSWATDGHKWPNAGYDCGLAFVRESQALRGAMAMVAAYLPEGARREPCHYTPEMSRRARGVELWALLRGMGRRGMAALIERTCAHAARFAEGLREMGFAVLNEVVINQVLVSFGTAERTMEVMRRVQAEGVCWCGETMWQGRVAMRISVSSWATTADDVERSLDSIRRASSV